jgi:coproporphyrinogen III oxidase-like Fe-S oxidoreductase
MMYLFPEQTEEELRDDIKLVAGLAPCIDQTTWRSLTYFPGTHYYDEAIRNGKFTEQEYRALLDKGYSFYKPNPKLNLSKIKDIPILP